MKKIFLQRMVPVYDQPFVVFLVGIRINKFWKVHKWWPVVRAMQGIIKELNAGTVTGFMGHESWLGNPYLSVQYWQSFQDLKAYAANKSASHFPAWVAYNKNIGRSGDVGLWHEIYTVEPGEYEAVYTNMPGFGLGRITKLDVDGGARLKTR
jgi:hypothetical protein